MFLLSHDSIACSSRFFAFERCLSATAYFFEGSLDLSSSKLSSKPCNLLIKSAISGTLFELIAADWTVNSRKVDSNLLFKSSSYAFLIACSILSANLLTFPFKTSYMLLCWKVTAPSFFCNKSSSLLLSFGNSMRGR